MKKTGRNDPCPCGSGKKFKKCCESKMIGGRFMATKIDPNASTHIKKTVNLSSFFQARLAETPKKPMPPVGSIIAEEVASTSEQSKENSLEKEQIC